VGGLNFYTYGPLPSSIPYQAELRKWKPDTSAQDTLASRHMGNQLSGSKVYGHFSTSVPMLKYLEAEMSIVHIEQSHYATLCEHQCQLLLMVGH